MGAALAGSTVDEAAAATVVVTTTRGTEALNDDFVEASFSAQMADTLFPVLSVVQSPASVLLVAAAGQDTPAAEAPLPVHHIHTQCHEPQQRSLSSTPSTRFSCRNSGMLRLEASATPPMEAAGFAPSWWRLHSQTEKAHGPLHLSSHASFSSSVPIVGDSGGEGGAGNHGITQPTDTTAESRTLTVARCGDADQKSYCSGIRDCSRSAVQHEQDGGDDEELAAFSIRSVSVAALVNREAEETAFSAASPEGRMTQASHEASFHVLGGGGLSSSTPECANVNVGNGDGISRPENDTAAGYRKLAGKHLVIRCRGPRSPSNSSRPSSAHKSHTSHKLVCPVIKSAFRITPLVTMPPAKETDNSVSCPSVSFISPSPPTGKHRRGSGIADATSGAAHTGRNVSTSSATRASDAASWFTLPSVLPTPLMPPAAAPQFATKDHGQPPVSHWKLAAAMQRHRSDCCDGPQTCDGPAAADPSPAQSIQRPMSHDNHLRKVPSNPAGYRNSVGGAAVQDRTSRGKQRAKRRPSDAPGAPLMPPQARQSAQNFTMAMFSSLSSINVFAPAKAVSRGRERRHSAVSARHTAEATPPRHQASLDVAATPDHVKDDAVIPSMSWVKNVVPRVVSGRPRENGDDDADRRRPLGSPPRDLTPHREVGALSDTPAVAGINRLKKSSATPLMKRPSLSISTSATSNNGGPPSTRCRPPGGRHAFFSPVSSTTLVENSTENTGSSKADIKYDNSNESARHFANSYSSLPAFRLALSGSPGPRPVAGAFLPVTAFDGACSRSDASELSFSLDGVKPPAVHPRSGAPKNDSRKSSRTSSSLLSRSKHSKKVEHQLTASPHRHSSQAHLTPHHRKISTMLRLFTPHVPSSNKEDACSASTSAVLTLKKIRDGSLRAFPFMQSSAVELENNLNPASSWQPGSECDLIELVSAAFSTTMYTAEGHLASPPPPLCERRYRQSNEHRLLQARKERQSSWSTASNSLPNRHHCCAAKVFNGNSVTLVSVSTSARGQLSGSEDVVTGPPPPRPVLTEVGDHRRSLSPVQTAPEANSVFTDATQSLLAPSNPFHFQDNSYPCLLESGGEASTIEEDRRFAEYYYARLCGSAGQEKDVTVSAPTPGLFDGPEPCEWPANSADFQSAHRSSYDHDLAAAAADTAVEIDSGSRPEVHTHVTSKRLTLPVLGAASVGSMQRCFPPAAEREGGEH